jgi:ComF family protein
MVGYDYTGLAKVLVKELKFSGRRGAAKEIAALMPAPPEVSTSILVPIPTATSRVRERGFDHALELTKMYARLHDLPYQQLLARTTQKRQLGASRKNRIANVSDAFRLADNPSLDLRATTIILIDDVATTGATLQEAAKVLKMAGAANIKAVVFARTPDHMPTLAPGH